MFVKYSCGCKGLVHKRDDGKIAHYVVAPCDYTNDGHRYGIEARDMEGRGYEHLPDTEALPLINTLTQLISKGQDFEEVQRIMSRGLVWPPRNST